jgi:hypothetical protein
MESLKEVISRIQHAGTDKVRTIPSGPTKVFIEIFEDGKWTRVLKELDRSIAEDVIKQATSKLILG